MWFSGGSRSQRTREGVTDGACLEHTQEATVWNRRGHETHKELYVIPHQGERRALTWWTNPHMQFLFTLCCLFPVSPSIFLFFSVSLFLALLTFSLSPSLLLPTDFFFLILSSLSLFFSFSSVLFLLTAPHPNPHPFFSHMHTRNLQHL